MFRGVFMGTLFLCLAACSSQKIIQPDAKTGYYPARTTAAVVSSVPFDIDARRALVLVPDNDFVKGEVANMGYFGQIITAEELEKAIVQQGLTDKVPAITDQIGLSNAAKNYKPFLWLHFKRRGSGTDTYSQFILTDPLSLQDLLIVETHLDFMWTGVNDQYNWYPMFNALIDYIRANSKTYRH